MQPIISPAGVWLAAQRNLTDATARGVVNPTQELPAQNFPVSIDEKQLEVKLKKLFVPLPNSISTPVNVENLTAELQDYPFPDIVSLFLAEHSEIEKRLFLCGRIAQYRGLGSQGYLTCMFQSFYHFFVLMAFSSVCSFSIFASE